MNEFLIDFTNGRYTKRPKWQGNKYVSMKDENIVIRKTDGVSYDR